MNKNSRIFIAGHKGLVGSAVYRNFAKKGYKNLYVISKNKLDLKDSEKVNVYFKKNRIEYLIICAARAGGILANSKYPVEFFNENILIQNSLLNAALKFNLKRTVFLHSANLSRNCSADSPTLLVPPLIQRKEFPRGSKSAKSCF